MYSAAEQRRLRRTQAGVASGDMKRAPLTSHSSKGANESLSKVSPSLWLRCVGAWAKEGTNSWAMGGE